MKSVIKTSKVFCVIISVFACFFSLSTKAQTKTSAPPIIDVHLHAFKIMPCATMADLKAPASQQEYENKDLALLKKYNIYAFTSSDDSVLQNWEAKEPERILPCKLVWSPKQVNMEELRQQIKDKKWDAIGEVLTQYEGLPANDPSIDSLYALAEKMDVPL